MQKMGWFGVVRGPSRSWAMSPFTIETMCLSFTVFHYSRLFAKSRRFWPTTPAFGASVGGDACRISWRYLMQKTRVPKLSGQLVNSTGTDNWSMSYTTRWSQKIYPHRCQHLKIAPTMYILYIAVYSKHCRQVEIVQLHFYMTSDAYEQRLWCNLHSCLNSH